MFSKKFKEKTLEINMFERFNLTPDETTEWFRLDINKDYYNHKDFSIVFVLFNFTIFELCYYTMKDIGCKEDEEMIDYDKQMLEFEENYTRSLENEN
jgi:hypothetical protein